MTSRVKNKIAVIGGGVSGIATAHYLLEEGYKVDLYEANSRLGGRMSLSNMGDREICFGGKNIGRQYSEFRKFIELHIVPAYEYFGINSARIVRGKIKPFNSQNKFQAIRNLVEAASISDILKLLRAVNAVKADRRNGDLCGPYFQNLKIEKYSSIEQYFSPKLSKSIIRSLTVRMNGAEPGQVSLENFGTHLQLLQDEFDQLQNPLSSLFEQFENHSDLNVYLNHEVESLKKSKRGFHLTTNGKTEIYQNIVLSLPANISSQLIGESFPEIALCLNQVRYFPVGVVIAEYENPVFDQEVRALTFGENLPLSNVGAYGIDDLNLARFTFSGKAAQEVLHPDIRGEELLAMGEAIAKPYLNISDNTLKSFGAKYWTTGLCGYSTQEENFQLRLEQVVEGCHGLFLTGDYLKGASLENCFRSAMSVVNKIVKQRSNRSELNVFA